MIDTPTFVPERRPWAAIFGWLLAVLGFGVAGVAGWLWWQQGAQLAGLRTDLDAAYAEVEALRARPVVSEPAAPPPDAGAIVPASDAADAAAATDVQLVPDDGSAAISAPPAAPPSAAMAAAAAPAIAGDTMPAAAPAAEARPPQAQ